MRKFVCYANLCYIFSTELRGIISLDLNHKPTKIKSQLNKYMLIIADIQKEYAGKIDRLDLDLIVAHVLKKSREFVLTHPEHALTTSQKLKTKNLLARRIKHEPLAYILGHKEFYGLDFKVTPDTLIPRPETELLVEEVLRELETKNQKLKTILDIGTGSGNIIISLAKNIHDKNNFAAIDISKNALLVAKQNAKKNKISEKIKFIHGNLLDGIKNIEDSIIIANLPYLSKEIYAATLPNVKKYEPRSALYSHKEGLDHYYRLLKQISQLNPTNCIIFMEISPEQKAKFPKIIKAHLPQAKIEFLKDLARKWRLCKITI